MEGPNQDTLHVWGASNPHDMVVISGSPKSLLELRDSIEYALAMGVSEREAFCNDGEGYPLYVVSVSQKEAAEMSLPYSSPEYAEKWNWLRGPGLKLMGYLRSKN